MPPESPLLVPQALRDAVDELRRVPLYPPDGVRRRVIAHRRRVRAAAADNPQIDLARAEQVARACLALLDDWPRTVPDHRAWVQAACLYFVRAEDDEYDFDSVIGFDDDAEVLEYVLDEIGRPDLKEP